MGNVSRRSVLRNSIGLAAAGTLGSPFIANAAATTAEVWWVQGFVPEEDVAFKKAVADYEKASGNTIELSIMPFAPQRQKIVSAVTSGVVPDMFPNNPTEVVSLFAWDDKLVDVSDVLATQREEFTETALINMNCYNSATKKRSFYGVPFDQGTLPNHVWRPLVEKAGYNIEDVPKTWDAYYDFFKNVQKKLREQGRRNVYGLGFQVTTNGNDPNSTFNNFLIAYGGQNIVTPDGKLHLDDPMVQEAVTKALTYPALAYKEGFVPPSAIKWNDADDNNAVPRQDDRDGPGWLDLDRGRDLQQERRLRQRRHDGSPAFERGQAGAEPSPYHLRSDSERGEECRGSKGIPQISDPAERRERVPEGRTRPQCPMHASSRERRSMVVRRPASEGLHNPGAVGTDDRRLLGVQSGLRPGAERTRLPDRLGGDRQRRRCAREGSRKGVETGGGDLRQVSDRLNTSPSQLRADAQRQCQQAARAELVIARSAFSDVQAPARFHSGAEGWFG